MPGDFVAETKTSRLRKIFYFFLYPKERLSQRVIHAGFWVFALRITDRVLGLVRTVVLARLLAPNDFGLFGIALLSMSALEIFSQTGFQQALIQKKGDIKSYLDTAWTVQVIRGLILTLLLFVMAPYIAAFFGEPEATWLLRVLALAILFQGLTNIGIIYFQKELEFHKQFVYLSSGTLVNLGVAVFAAFILRNAWALIFGLLAGNLTRMIISYIIHPYRPTLRFQTAKVKELFSFGLWIWGIGIVGFLALQADKVIVGKLLGATALGFYAVATQFANIVVMDVGRLISGVAFPAYSKIQDEPTRLKNGFLATLEVVLFISLPLTIVIVFLAPELTSVFLGERWMPIVGALQLLAVAGLIRGIIAPCGALVRAVGRPKIEFWLTLIRTAIMIALAIPLSQIWGITGTAAATLLGVGITLPIWWYISLRITEISKPLLFGKLVPSLFAGTMMVCFIILMKAFFNGGGLLTIANIILIGTIAYLIPLLALWRYLNKGPISLFFALLNKNFGSLNSGGGLQK